MFICDNNTHRYTLDSVTFNLSQENQLSLVTYLVRRDGYAIAELTDPNNDFLVLLTTSVLFKTKEEVVKDPEYFSKRKLILQETSRYGELEGELSVYNCKNYLYASVSFPQLPDNHYEQCSAVISVTFSDVNGLPKLQRFLRGISVSVDRSADENQSPNLDLFIKTNKSTMKLLYSNARRYNCSVGDVVNYYAEKIVSVFQAVFENPEFEELERTLTQNERENSSENTHNSSDSDPFQKL